MAENSIIDPNEGQSPSALEDNGVEGGRPQKRQRTSNAAPADDADSDEDKPGRERRKIEIKFIQDKSRRHITFSKRKAGIMKKVSHAHAVRRPRATHSRRAFALQHWLLASRCFQSLSL